MLATIGGVKTLRVQVGGQECPPPKRQHVAISILATPASVFMKIAGNGIHK